MIWAEAAQADLVAAIVGHSRRRVVAVGGPAEADAAAVLAAVSPPAAAGPAPTRFRDLRHAVSTLATESGAAPPRVLVAARGALEGDERAALRASGTSVLSLEPRPARLPDFLAESSLEDPVRTPRLAASPAWRVAADAIADFGPITLLEIAMASRPEEGSLHARLHDAMDVLDRLAGRPAGVAAGMDRGPGDVPEHLSALRGSMAVEIRGAEGWCAAVAATDAAPTWSRRVAATGPAGHFVLDDAGFTWTGADGRMVERLSAKPGSGAGPGSEAATARDSGPGGGDGGETSPGVAAIAEALLRPAADPLDRTSHERRIRRYALCEAARLAARTGERESPARLVSVMGG